MPELVNDEPSARRGTTTVADWGALAVANSFGFKRATSVVEFGAGDFSRSLALAERYPKKQFLSTDYEFSDKANANLPLIEQIPNVDVARLDARTIDLPAESVDFVFSIALMEHIAQLDECLAAVHRVLRPGGSYFYIQAPFWSCAQGHHFEHSDDRTYEFIPKYAHLIYDRDGLTDLLRDGPEPPFDIEWCIYRIYARADLSRLGLYETKAIVESGPLDVVSWRETRDSRYNEAMATAAFARLRAPLQFEELAVSGAEVVLRKAGPRDQSASTARLQSMMRRARHPFGGMRFRR